MFRKFCNYLAVVALSLTVAGSAVSANASGIKSNAKARSFTVDTNKEVEYRSERIAGSGSHTYNLKVEAGKKVKIKIRAADRVSLRVETPDGAVQEVPAEKFFELKLKKEGQYVIKIQSDYNSTYTLESRS